MERVTMQWNVRWDSLRREIGAVLRGSSRSTRRPEPMTEAEWEGRLVELGISGAWAETLASRLLAIHGDHGRGSAEALLQGAALAAEVQAEQQADVERSLRDVREVERLLGAFSGELEKLDEVLEVLAAYAQRMRPQPSQPQRRTLH